MENFACDVLVLGSGAAGLRAAIAAREKGMDVCIISKGSPGKATCTGISGGVFAGTREGASTESHLARTLQAGRGLNQQKLVEILVVEGPKRLKELKQWGLQAEFKNGYLYSKGRPPIWGEGIVNCLVLKNKALGTRFVSGLVAVELKMKQEAGGVLAYSADGGGWAAISAGALILATGGAGALYLRHDNPRRILGDGYVLALKAGAVLQDLEFVQFYPLGLREPGLPPFLVPPRLADCGRMFNNKGEEIYDKYNIQERPAAERARDKLSQALFTEIYRDGEEVLLDLRAVAEDDWLEDPFCASSRQILGERYGAKHGVVRVAPMAHHVMGGVVIDGHCATSVPGLFAAGEVTGGLHGANRMGGNALTETLVFGKRAGEAAAAWVNSQDATRNKKLFAEIEVPMVRCQKNTTGVKTVQLQNRLKKILWEEGGILKNRKGLMQALKEVKTIQTQAPDLFFGDNPKETLSILELRSGARTAELILQAALRRQESRGAHFREDFPRQDDENWRGHLQVHLDSKGHEIWKYHPNSS
jgi:fumarate reductase (CoM/CoB) subunit A